jgi:predicted phosphodiesterase
MSRTLEQFAAKHESSNLGISQILGLQEQLNQLAVTRAAHKIEIGDKGKPFRFGVISCTHFGSLYEEVGITSAAYDWFQQESVANVFHCGDMTEGVQMRKGHEHEVHKHGADAQIDWTCVQYPYRKGITTHLISGNHDAAHMKNGGVDVCRRIAEKREDINYIGNDAARFIVERAGEKTIAIDMLHPDGGSSYALSYKPQKIIEQIESGSKPDVLLIGHFHKAFTLPAYRGVSCILAACTQRQTGFMRRNGLAAHVGVHICEMRILDGQKVLSSTFREFFPQAQHRTID